MNNIRIIFVLFLFTTKISAQDTIRFPKEMIPPFQELKSQLNQPLSHFPFTSSFESTTNDFEVIESFAKEVQDSLELTYIEYFSETNAPWDPIDFQDHFLISSSVNNHPLIDHNRIKLEIDTTKKSSIYEEEKVILESGIYFSHESDQIALYRKIIPPTKVIINKEGSLTAAIKYLTVYDTIRLNKKSIGSEFRIADANYNLEGISNGNIYLKVLDPPMTATAEKFQYVALRDNRIIHNNSSLEGPWEFKNVIHTYSGFLNDSLAKLSTVEYEEYLNKSTFLKSDLQSDLLILATGLDFDEILLLLPTFDYFTKELQGKISKENVDDLTLVGIKVPVEEKPSIKNGNGEN
jgi:hypothetical protein